MSDFEGYVPVAGGRLWAQAAGEGTGVVLVHAGIADARMWDPQWEALAARHRVVRYDTRGFGRSETADVPFANRADLVAVMDAAGLDRAVAVGCSRGGSIALDAVIDSPDRFSGLVWVCSGVGGLETIASPLEMELDARDEALYEAKDWEAVADLDVARWVDGPGQPAGRAPEAIRSFVRQMDLETLVLDKPTGQPIAAGPAGRRPPGGDRRAGDWPSSASSTDRARPRPRTRWSPGSRGHGGSTCRTSPTCRTSSVPSGSPRRCWGSWPRSADFGGRDSRSRRPSGDRLLPVAVDASWLPRPGELTVRATHGFGAQRVDPVRREARDRA